MRLAIALLPLVFAKAAFAADDAALQSLVFGHALGKEAGYACFTRAYSRGHLSGHRKQNVTSIKLLVKGMVEDQAHYSATVDFRFRHSGKHFQATGDCPALSVQGQSGKPNELHCGIDCDGGTINVSLKDAETILVKLPDGIAVSGSGNDDAPSSDRFGSDDKIFKLTREPAIDCLPLAQEEDKAAVKAAK
jgi:hypothetical protein